MSKRLIHLGIANLRIIPFLEQLLLKTVARRTATVGATYWYNRHSCLAKKSAPGWWARGTSANIMQWRCRNCRGWFWPASATWTAPARAQSQGGLAYRGPTDR